jgi:hypothetical protein
LPLRRLPIRPERFFDKLKSPILYSEHMVTDGNEMFAVSCKLGWEDHFQERRSTLSLGPQ